MYKKIIYVIIAISLLFGCNRNSEPTPPMDDMNMDLEMEVEGVDYFLPNIDLSNWKVTLPIGNPTEVEPPKILEYATNPILKDFMYNDSIDGSLVFRTFPGSTTTNTTYSRTELREQMKPGSNSVNWKFDEGGRMKGKLKLESISKKSNGDYDRVIIMQIHGRLSNEQRDLIGEDDNNAPPILKIYWNDNRVRVLRKVLKDLDVDDLEILKTDAWTDEGQWFEQAVNFEPFTLEIIASDSKLEVILNDDESMVFEDIHMEKWNVFENYFKAGNYLISTDESAFSTIKFYELEVKH